MNICHNCDKCKKKADNDLQKSVIHIQGWQIPGFLGFMVYLGFSGYMGFLFFFFRLKIFSYGMDI